LLCNSYQVLVGIDPVVDALSSIVHNEEVIDLGNDKMLQPSSWAVEIVIDTNEFSMPRKSSRVYVDMTG